MPKPAQINSSGFTLIELSIVLVIIGLLVGGILVGRDLISAAEIRREISQVQALNTAVATFYGKFGALPGDMQNATDYWATAVNGNGNGMIETDNATTYEGYNALHHLSLAQLVPGVFNPITAPPAHPPGSNYAMTGAISQTYYNIDNTTTYLPPATTLPTQNYITVSSATFPEGVAAVGYLTFYTQSFAAGASIGLTPLQASIIDGKIDDGLPYSGKVVAIFYGAVPRWCAMSDNSNAYAVTINQANCMIAIRLSVN